MTIPNRFPNDFIWGAGISSAQTEGMHHVDGSGPSIWDDFVLRNGKIKNNHTNQKGCNF